MQMSDLIRRVRAYLGDQSEAFRTGKVSDGQWTWWNLPKQNVYDVVVSQISGMTITDLVVDVDYTLDELNGIVLLNAPIPSGQSILVTGSAYAMLTDTEIEEFCNDAITQHIHGRTISERYQDTHGFIKYRETTMDLANLPEIEDLLVVMLATIEALWALSTDASTEIDVITAEGTHLPMSQRWGQIRAQIDELTHRYQDLCNQLNVGLHRVEIFTLRRRSMRTGRYVPIFTTREYDDFMPPHRQLPPIDSPNQDESGIPNPVRGYGYGV